MHFSILNHRQDVGQRVAFLNMSDPSEQCPSAWREYSGVRVCGRPGQGCWSVNYSSSVQYRRVCGRVVGYQVGSTDVFNSERGPIDGVYVDGISITTSGVPRTHIWTYVAGISEHLNLYQHNCPCLLEGTSYRAQIPPSFVGDNYYCESGNPDNMSSQDIMYTRDPIWDGQQCEGQCCSNGRSPPWFSVELPNSTSKQVEVRICGSETIYSEDTPINLLEIFVQ